MNDWDKYKRLMKIKKAILAQRLIDAETVGSLMANVMFNLAQGAHIAPHDQAIFDELRRAWDRRIKDTV